jgi:hypothetical protein
MPRDGSPHAELNVELDAAMCPLYARLRPGREAASRASVWSCTSTSSLYLSTALGALTFLARLIGVGWSLKDDISMPGSPASVCEGCRPCCCSAE